MRLVAIAILIFVLNVAPAAPRLRHAPDPGIVAVASFRVAELWDAPIFKDARATFDAKSTRFRDSVVRNCGIAPADVERVTHLQFKYATGDGEMLGSVTVVVPRKAPNPALIATATGRKVLHEKGKWAEVPDFALLGTEGRKSCIAVGDKAIVLLPELEHLSEDKAERQALEAALEAAMVVKAVQRDGDRATWLAREKLLATVSLDLPEMSKALGGLGGALGGGLGECDPQALPEALRALTKARILTLNVAVEKALVVRGELIFATADDAAAGKASVEAGLKQLQELLDQSKPEKADLDESKTKLELIAFATALLQAGKIDVKDRSVSFTATRPIEPAFAGILAKGVVLVETAAARAQSFNNLRQLGIAAQNHHDTFGDSLLENICDDRGKPLLSWRVKLLPYLEQQALFEEFKLDEPWDSEHNKKLIPKMPKVYVLPSPKPSKEGTTFYQTFLGKKGVATRPVLQEGEAKGLGVNTITDGFSFTLLIVEAPDAVTWTRPDDIPFDPEGKAPKLGGHFDGGFFALFCDGSVKFLKDTMPEKTLKAIITANGGEEVTLDD